ncbi:MAG: MurT ligase domain-containing protein [Erysipelotrichia bacterium]|nr:MurT ligase domain-containing protein [Erysipelotrichia bacterium]
MFFYLGLWASKIYYRFFEKNKEADRMGIVALKFDDKFLYHIAKPKLVIAVTGTNGKTTTCNILADLFRKEGYRVAFNQDGCNLRPGLSKALILNTSVFGKSQADVAILEFDELSTKDLLAAVKPDYVICTNLFMDTMGRNGHTDYVFNKINEGLPQESTLILNSDDLISSQLGKKNKRIFFSIAQQKNEKSKNISKNCDIKICPNCGNKLVFDFIRYHHIGRAHCPVCSFQNEKAQYVVTDYDDYSMTVNGEKFKLLNNSLFNIYNQLSALVVAKECGLKHIAHSFESMEIVHSRFFNEKIGDVRVVFQMTKGQNPVSLSRAMDYVSNLPGKKNIIIIIDDLFDMRSQERSEVISYIYDTDYECLNKEDIDRVIVAGVRYADYKVRLLLAKIPSEKIVAIKDETKCVDFVQDGVDTVAVVHDIYQYRNADIILRELQQRFGK